MRRFLPILLLSLPGTALAQMADPHAGHHMEGGSMPGMSMPEMPMPKMSMAQDGESAGTDQSPGSAAPPAMAHDRLADRYWDPAEMAAAERSAMGAPVTTYAKVLFDLAEYQIRDGKDGYRWEGEAWLGDVDRFVIKSKGEGTFGSGIDHAELQALYAKALDPWWNLQFGARQDLGPGAQRSWATIGLEGRARYQFETQAAAFLSDKGQLTARIETAYDQRITQRLVLQPRAEVNLSAQDMRAERIGAGLTIAELGLRLRYEVRREFAPYLGMNWTWLSGRTADYARADGRDANEASVVAGIRAWF
ncbi:copper resistance protein B [Novosphingobium sp. PhB165]|uniref:copper resistance protein B n=1 Tax=Novosphingobium sp. PhB165 TaxID=2485105 RepID=UPI0010E13815|nr:copper resistance protein B [Novosphingobium sp. PhB165]TCM20541.1 copper resistance protein B [Novosphingobium sp. PhB165]